MTNPSISVVIPVYDGERYLGEVLSDLFADDYEPVEVIVVDDGSTDKSAAIARSFGVTVIPLGDCVNVVPLCGLSSTAPLGPPWLKSMVSLS